MSSEQLEERSRGWVWGWGRGWGQGWGQAEARGGEGSGAGVGLQVGTNPAPWPPTPNPPTIHGPPTSGASSQRLALTIAPSLPPPRAQLQTPTPTPAPTPPLGPFASPPAPPTLPPPLTPPPQCACPLMFTHTRGAGEERPPGDPSVRHHGNRASERVSIATQLRSAKREMFINFPN